MNTKNLETALAVIAALAIAGLFATLGFALWAAGHLAMVLL